VISCHKCKQSNPAEAKLCQNCGADLLPGESISGRLILLISGIFGGLFSVGMIYVLANYPDIADSSCMFTNPVIWYISSVLLPIIGIVSSLRKTQVYQRYELRAKRHIATDPEQAVRDLSTALDLAPEKEKAALLKQRAEIYKTLGREEDEAEDRLAYLESEGAYKNQAGLAQVLGGDTDVFIAGQKDSERRQLVKDGKIDAVGYCPLCQKAVILNQQIRCDLHPNKKPLAINYALHKNRDATLLQVEEQGLKQFKRKKKKRMIFLIILAVIFILCVVVPIISNLFPRLFGG
jgi:hypothetical protein